MSQALTNYDKAWAEQAQRYAQQEQLTGGTFLSTRGGILSFGDEVMPGNQACVVILDSVHENTFYSERFDPDAKAAPVCYAFGHDGTDMAPHESMQVDLNYFQAQNDVCKGCKWNEWGSADKGRGKACQNRRRLAMIPAGFYKPKRGSRDFDLDLFTDPKHFEQADIAYMKLPVTSVEHWSKYVNSIAASVQRPPHGVITRVFLEGHAKFQYQVCFELLEKVPDELAQIMFARHAEAEKSIVQGYRVPEQPATAPQGSLRGLRR